MTGEAPPIGHNNPPDEVEAFVSRVRLENADLLAERVDLEFDVAGAPKAPASDEDVAAINEMVVKLRGYARRLEGAREDAKRPLLGMGRGSDALFTTVRDAMKATADQLERRNGPFLQAKAVKLEQERQAKLAEQRRLEQEAEQRRQDEAAERQRLEDEAAAARQKIIDANTAEEREAAAALAVNTERDAQLARDAEEQAEKDRQKLSKAADRTERKADTALERTAGGGGASKLTEERKWRWGREDSREALRASLGPLAPYLSESAVIDAIARAAKADPAPIIPGVEFYVDVVASTTASRPKP